MTPTSPAAEDFAPVPDRVADGSGQPPCYGTGLTALDTVTGGGTRPGCLWLITGGPGQGRSTLLTQLAANLATQHELATYLVSNRDPASLVAARIHANRARIPLSHIIENRLTDRDRQRLTASIEDHRAMPLEVAAGPYARHRTTDQLHRLAQEHLIVAAFDDPDWETEWNLHEARGLADRGAIVLVTATHDRLLRRTTDGYDLKAATGMADVVLDIRHDRVSRSFALEPVPEPGRATITPLRNRYGPRYLLALGFYPHLAKFYDPQSG